jgi:serine/threonine-protein kinase
VSPRTDVYALGLIAYYLLSGHVYWRTPHSAEAKLAALLLEIVEASHDPPSQRARELGAEVSFSPAFDRWFLKCIAAAPEKRFESASDAVDALEAALLRDESPTAMGPVVVDEMPPDRSAFALDDTQQRSAPAPAGDGEPAVDPPELSESMAALSSTRHAPVEPPPSRRRSPLPLAAVAALVVAGGAAAVLLGQENDTTEGNGAPSAESLGPSRSEVMPETAPVHAQPSHGVKEPSNRDAGLAAVPGPIPASRSVAPRAPDPPGPVAKAGHGPRPSRVAAATVASAPNSGSAAATQASAPASKPSIYEQRKR